MKDKLSQIERLLVALIYIAIMFIMFSFIGGSLKTILDYTNDVSIWFYSGALLIILGTYVTEPFFSKPTDTIANTISLMLSLIAINKKNDLKGYYVILIFTAIIFILSILTILFKDKETKFKKVLFWIVLNLGTSKIIFSTVYLSASYSYFANQDHMKSFVVALALWICIVFFDIVGKILIKIKGLITLIREKTTSIVIGTAINCKNPFLYTIEVDKSKEGIAKIGDIIAVRKGDGVFHVGMIVNIKKLISKEWLDIHIICKTMMRDISSNMISSNNEFKTIFDRDLSAFLLPIDLLQDSLKEDIFKNEFYENRNEFIGYIEPGSNINTIKFSIIKDMFSSVYKIKEGAILTVKIYGEDTLYQVIDGVTKQEELENKNTNTYITGFARKLGKYNYENKEINVVKWLPNTYESVYLSDMSGTTEEALKELAINCIGRLPETNMGIPLLDINSLITHNTAILGILGIGKSCLSYEIISKITSKGIKSICIDITNQYYSDRGLLEYISKDGIQKEISDEYLSILKDSSQTTGEYKSPAGWGNETRYKKCIKKVFEEFIASDKSILILNPDKHSVTKPASLFNVTDLMELTLVEKVRIISEAILDYAMLNEQTDEAKYLIVYEEAHSLIPEWNSISNPGDDKASSGIAKVILQGRKYGLGCLVITQRTANVSKSILNQCNTIFALRIFDDTGKMFLENYIGQDYSNTLPTLEERHAVVIGKALKLKQPIIIQLNDKKFLKYNDIENEAIPELLSEEG